MSENQLDIQHYQMTSLQIWIDEQTGRALIYNSNSIADKSVAPLIGFDEAAEVLEQLTNFYDEYGDAEIETHNTASAIKKSDTFTSRPGYVYVMQSGQHFKIGYTHTSPNIRRLKLQAGNPNPVNLVLSRKTANPIDWETKLHEQFASKRVRGEWFSLDISDITYIENLMAGGIWS